jgi:hypothetical protein
MDSKFYFRLIVFTLLGLVNAQWAAAQNVTISPKNGSLLCASKGTSQGYSLGSFATWRHNQLSLTMTGANESSLTSDGQLSEHANHLTAGDKLTFTHTVSTSDASNWLSVAWGQNNYSGNVPGYFTIALPKGYRFTGYTFHLTRDVSGIQGQSTYHPNTTSNVTISEMRPNLTNPFSEVIKSATVEPWSTTNSEPVEFKRTGDDMGNILYFRTISGGYGFFELNCRYIELTFTADADATVAVEPSSSESSGKSLLEIPFHTGKVDFGAISKGTDESRQSYVYTSMKDISANLLLYEEESVEDNKTAFDGTVGKMAISNSGSITTSGNYFRLSPSSSKTEQVYFLETPVSAPMPNNPSLENPVQFRIVGAVINYAKESGKYYIKYMDGETPLYLGTDAKFSSTPIEWEIDNNGRIHNGNSYLRGTTGNVTVVNRTNNATTFQIYNNHIVYRANNYSTRYYLEYTTNGARMTNDANASSIATFAESDYKPTIYVYDKEGANPQEIQIENANNYLLSGLNNDAIKIGVKGGDVALVNFSLILQALNPFIDQMTVVLNDTYNGKNIRQTRTFTADDFSVGGDTFKFYLPTDCIHDPLTITFEDLYSKYGDDTYDHTDKPGTSDSRYNFVMSQHHQAFTNDNIYNGKTEAASDQKESDRIAKNENVRTKVGTVGDKAFRFNNADELSEHSGYLTEYPFTLARYATQTKPGAGQFITAEFNQGVIDADDWSTRMFYVFTTDETRYNIAPTTATQHRFYAFYEMIVQVLCDDYEPSVEFTKKYDKTLTEASNGGIDESAYYGVRVFVEDEDVEYPLASDVATYKAISEAIKKGGNNVPKNLKQILYVDMSGLNGVYHSNSTINVKNDAGTVTATYSLDSFDKLRGELAPNALIFLPVNSTDRFDNFAYAKKGEVAGSFQSANNIILTDKSPFYTPYTIQVDAANYATYTRLRTAASEDLVKKATVVLPFTMKVTNGKHTNDTEDGFEFNLRELKKLTAQTGTDQYGTEGVEEGKGNFVLIEGEETKANYPYMVEVTSANGSEYSFIAAQKGSNIVATPETITGETEAETGLTNTGTYSGVKLSTAKNFFYFTKNKYVSSKTAKNKYTEIYVQPFRAYYVDPAAGSKLSMFEIVYDELDENEGLITGITTARSHGPLTVVTGNGYMTLTSAEDINVTVYNIKGAMVANMKMSAGEQQNINVPAGVYLVNKNKVIVK